MDQTDFTQLLHDARTERTGGPFGDKACAELFRRAQSELRAIASGKLRRERPDHTLQPTALVNEAYLRLFGGNPIDFKDRRHFFATAALTMQRVLLEHARNRNRQRRDGKRERVPLSVVDLATDGSVEDVLAVNEALAKLADQDPRLAELVKLRYLAGLSIEETAAALDLSEKTVQRDWKLARAWLARELGGESEQPDGE